eukprot:2897043-Pyramimonas_sp.AAC.1
MRALLATAGACCPPRPQVRPSCAAKLAAPRPEPLCGQGRKEKRTYEGPGRAWEGRAREGT